MRFSLLWAVIFAAVLTPGRAVACSCLPPLPGFKTPQQLAEAAAKSAEAIFEGTVSRAELKWNVIEARVGDLLPADMEKDYPHMLVTFDAPRFYIGIPQEKTQVRTGLGGGDCGYRFEIGKRYLVYAYPDGSGLLHTGICSATALLENSRANLEYLRNEAVAVDEAARIASQETGRLCGSVIRNGLGFSDSRILLFALVDNSPIPLEEADPDESGSFCVEGVAPGKYRLLYVDGVEDNPAAFAFFSGTTRPSDATEVEVKRGTNPSLAFNIPLQDTFAVNGTVLLHNASKFPEEYKVVLINADHQLFVLSYSQDVAADGSFKIPRVISGKYWAFVQFESSEPSGWQTRKIELDVTSNVTDLTLELIAE